MSTIRLVFISTLLAAGANAQAPLGTAWTFQGHLESGGSPASGLHDLRFRLYDATLGGTPIGPAVCADDVNVTDGLFAVELDFGAQFAGQERFLEVDVRTDTGLECADATGFTTLAPRQAITAAPSSLFALNAATASSATLLDGQPASYYRNASNMNAGTLADARLTANVALLHTNQTFTGGKAFSTAPAFTAAGAPFFVTSTARVNNLNADLLDGLHASAFLQSVPVPLTLSGSSATQIFMADNAASDLGASAIRGLASAAGGLTYGVVGVSNSPAGRGVAGQATAATGVTLGVQGVSASTDGRGVYGNATAASGSTYGGYFEAASTDAAGVLGLASATSGITTGVYGRSDSTEGRAVVGYAGAATGDARGVYGMSESTSGRGVFGWALASSGANYGVYGQSDGELGCGVYGVATAAGNDAVGGQFESATGDGVVGIGTRGGYFASDSAWGRGVVGMSTVATSANNTYGGQFFAYGNRGVGVAGTATASSGITYGVYGDVDSDNGRAVYGTASATGGSAYGGYFECASTSGYGVYGRNNATSGTIYGVRGYASTAAGGYAVYAAGDMGASGAKPFRIDHPLDPENKYLLHYSTESPEVLNAYSGKVLLDERGEAMIELPPYFASINKDPRYTLTAVGAPMPNLHVAEEIDEQALRSGEQAGPGAAPPVCTFRIAGGVPGAKVSWRVEALRNDLRIRLQGAPVEREKSDSERGKYQHPEYYGQPPEMGMDYHPPEARSESERPSAAMPDDAADRE